jgi:hypothetical protein
MDWWVSGRYKKRPTRRYAGTFADVDHWMEDDHFQQVLEVMRWAAFELIGDQRAGGVSTNNFGQAHYSGQYARAMDAMNDMAKHEGIELGDIQIYPSESLVSATNVRPTFWGF